MSALVTSVFVRHCVTIISLPYPAYSQYFSQYGEVIRVSVAAKQNSAFVEYNTRDEAEKAVEVAYQGCIIKEVALRVLWGRSKAKAAGDFTTSVPALPGMPGMVPMPPGMGLAPPPGGPPPPAGGMMLPPGLGLAPPPGIGTSLPDPIAVFDFALLAMQLLTESYLPFLGGGLSAAPPVRGGSLYPSMDPSRMGSRAPNADGKK